ncbi:MAG: hypothetical protein QOG56_2953 [Solirubrobacteraceae bacterium]|nr:hypothetical protein [Solirubrobacteraceae bacterium]
MDPEPATSSTESEPDAPTVAYVAVVGAGEDVPAAVLDQASAVGAELARRGAVLVCGGLGGVMEAACRGAIAAGGTTLGILPGGDRDAGNRWLTVAIATGLGELRNGLVVRSVDAVIAIAGGYGTLSEIALALKAGKRVVGLGSWEIPGVLVASDPVAAVTLTLR